jgi:hypothetical protein
MKLRFDLGLLSVFCFKTTAGLFSLFIDCIHEVKMAVACGREKVR